MPFLRDDFEGLKTRIARGYGSGEQATTFVGQVTAVSVFPSAANRFYAVARCTIVGPEVEGGPASITADAASVVYAYNLGGQAPPIGAMVVVESVANRWVFSYG